MKKIIAIVLVLSLVLSLTACGGTATETTVPTVTPTVAPTTAPTTAPTVTPTETPEVEESGSGSSTSWVSLPAGATTTTTTPSTSAEWDGSFVDGITEYTANIDEEDISAAGALVISDADFSGDFTMESISDEALVYLTALTVYLPNGSFTVDEDVDLSNVTLTVTTKDESFHVKGKVGAVTINGGRAVFQAGSETGSITTAGASSVQIDGVVTGDVTVEDAITVAVTGDVAGEVLIAKEGAVLDISELTDIPTIVIEGSFMLVIPEGMAAEEITIIVNTTETIEVIVEYPAVEYTDEEIAEFTSAAEAALGGSPSDDQIAAKVEELQTAAQAAVVTLVAATDVEMSDGNTVSAIESVADATLSADTLSAFLASSQMSIVIEDVITLTADATIPAGKTVTVASGVTLATSEYTLTNNGTLIVNGTLDSTDGTFTNAGTLLGSGIGDVTSVAVSNRLSGVSKTGNGEVMLNDNSYKISSYTFNTETKVIDIVIELTDDLYIYYANEKVACVTPASGTWTGAYTGVYVSLFDGTDNIVFGSDTTDSAWGTYVDSTDMNDTGAFMLYPNYVSGEAYTKTIADTQGVEYTFNVSYKNSVDVSVATSVSGPDVAEGERETYDVTAVSIKDCDMVIPSGVTLTIPEGVTLTVASGYKLTIEEGATIAGAGTLEVASGGTFVLNGTDAMTEDGSITAESGSTVTGSSVGMVTGITAAVRSDDNIIKSTENPTATDVMNDDLYSVKYSYDAEAKEIDVAITANYLYLTHESEGEGQNDDSGVYTGIYIVFEGIEDISEEMNYNSIDCRDDSEIVDGSVNAIMYYPNYVSGSDNTLTFTDEDGYAYTINITYPQAIDLVIAEEYGTSYALNTDIVVPEGSTLTIEAGVTVTATGSSTITNNGTVINYGTMDADVIDGDSTGTVYNAVTDAAGIAAAVAAGGNVMMMANITANVEIAEGKTVTLDLNGFTLTNDTETALTEKESGTITNNGTLTLKDTSVAQTGTVTNVTNNVASVYNYRTLTIESGNYTRLYDNYAVEMESGVANCWYVAVNNGTMTINGGTFYGAVGGNVSTLVINGYGKTDDASTLTINGGSFTNAGDVVKNADGTVTINDGSFTKDNTTVAWQGGNGMIFNEDVMNITGGSFELKGMAERSYNAGTYNNSAFSNNSSGVFTITGGTLTVSQIDMDDTDASMIGIYNSSANATFYISNVDFTTNFYVAAGTLTINNSATITVPSTETLDASKVDSGATLTNNGTIYNYGSIVGDVAGNAVISMTAGNTILSDIYLSTVDSANGQIGYLKFYYGRLAVMDSVGLSITSPDKETTYYTFSGSTSIGTGWFSWNLRDYSSDGYAYTSVSDISFERSDLNMVPVGTEVLITITAVSGETTDVVTYNYTVTQDDLDNASLNVLGSDAAITQNEGTFTLNVDAGTSTLDIGAMRVFVVAEGDTSLYDTADDDKGVLKHVAYYNATKEDGVAEVDSDQNTFCVVTLNGDGTYTFTWTGYSSATAGNYTVVFMAQAHDTDYDVDSQGYNNDLEYVTYSFTIIAE